MFASRAARGDYDRQDTHNTPKRGSVSRKLKTSMEITKSPTMSPKTKTPVNLSRTDLGANFYRKLANHRLQHLLNFDDSTKEEVNNETGSDTDIFTDDQGQGQNTVEPLLPHFLYDRSPTPSRQDGEPQTRGAKTSVVETEVEHQNLSTPSVIPEADLVVWLEQQKRVSGTGGKTSAMRMKECSRVENGVKSMGSTLQVPQMERRRLKTAASEGHANSMKNEEVSSLTLVSNYSESSSYLTDLIAKTKPSQWSLPEQTLSTPYTVRLHSVTPQGEREDECNTPDNLAAAQEVRSSIA
ncbi:hypothetical protein EB796_006211 [Bugula neritina]|uniref:Uncharacterized protein n=1 Tax=Bugula neritina TaxID=10212 RepID=A0A7J7KBA8_BUGNE|nr:hypothetical protein EB796_006211 [Bugula neritina]